MAGGGVKVNNFTINGGANGKTPTFKIEGGHLYNSYDNGTTWGDLGQVKGSDGQDGQDGSTGAKLVSQVLQGQDANGGNIYLQTFDDGTTAYFTAPKGEKGDAGGGGGGVTSVNGQTGTVVLDTDDISDTGATHKFVTASEKSKISNNETAIENIINGSQVVGKSLTSEQLENVSDESGSYQDKPFTFQGTGTNSNTDETPTAPIAKQLELRGYSVVFNQLVDTNTEQITTISSHKYLKMISGTKSIFTSAGETLSVTGSTDNVFYLTLMFGVGNEPTTVLEFNRLFPLPYYAYNAGTIQNCQSTKLVNTGYNQFSGLDTFIKVIAGQTYRLMYWDGTALSELESGSIVEYDGSQSIIATTTYDNLSYLHTLDSDYPDNGDVGIKLTDDTQYVKIVSVSENNVLFNLAWDGSRADYEPYVKHEYTLPNVELKSAGSVYDVYKADGTRIQKIQSVDLGTLTWSKYTVDGDTHTYYYSTGISSTVKRATNTDYVPNLFCEKYIAKSFLKTIWGKYYSETQGNGINIYTNGVIFIYDADFDSSESTVEAFTASLSGVMMNYELATPTTTQGQSFAENVEVDDFGTMEFVSNIPQGNRFFYPADYVLFIDDMYHRGNGNPNDFVKQSELALKQDKPTIETTNPTQSLTAVANTEYYFGTLTALTVTFPTGNTGDLIQINFTGTDNMTVDFGSNITTLDTTFKANTRYSITAQKDNDLWWLLCVERELNNNA